MRVIRELNKQPVLQLSSKPIYVFWRYRGYLVDPRLFVSYEDGGIMMSGRLSPKVSPENAAEKHRKYISEGKTCLNQPMTVIAVDWKYGKSVHDKRLVFHLESGKTYTTGPLPREMDVPAIAQSFFKKDWVGDGK